MNIDFIHRPNPRSKRIKISLSHLGEVIVSSPPHVDSKIIRKFVQDNLEWIDHHRQKILAHKSQRPANSISIFGQNYPLHFQIANKHLSPGVHLHEKKLLIVGLTPNQENWQKTLQRFIKSVSSTYFLQVVPKLAKQMNVKVGRIAFKTQKTRWGSCSSRGNLNFNWRLVHAPKEIINYVIIHELAHRIHMDHSKNFWSLVAKFDPNFKQHRNWLKKEGHSLMT